MRRRRPRVQECSKRFDGGCFLCPETGYDGLQTHRIVPGSAGGTYHPWNVLTLCATCHQKVTKGRIRIHAAHHSTLAVRVIHWTDEDGVDHWDAWPKRAPGGAGGPG